MGVVRFIPWLGSLLGRDSRAARWLVVAGLGLALAVLVVARLASSNEVGLRIAARRELDAALRVLATARRDCPLHDHHDDAAQIGRLTMAACCTAIAGRAREGTSLPAAIVAEADRASARQARVAGADRLQGATIREEARQGDAPDLWPLQDAQDDLETTLDRRKAAN